MSTEITRAMTKAHPLGADDIAAVSILYPTPAWAGLYGSMTGQVTMNGIGVALASVVALTPGGDAVSTLTNPDGTYEIDGLSAGSYQVYVHPVPPSLAGESYSGDLIPPIGSQGTIQMGPPFNTIFLSGSASPGNPVTVSAGNTTAGVNFAVTPRSSVNIYGVQTYTFLWDQIAQGYDTAKPATFILGNATGTAVITGDGLFSSDGVSPAPGLSASVLGAPDMIQSSVAAYTYGAGFLQFQVSTAAQSTPGPQHLILSQAGEMEIVPSAISLAAAAPPAITAVQQNSDGTANVAGSGIGPGTRILFDGGAAAGSAGCERRGDRCEPGRAGLQLLYARRPSAGLCLRLGPTALYSVDPRFRAGRSAGVVGHHGYQRQLRRGQSAIRLRQQRHSGAEYMDDISAARRGAGRDLASRTAGSIDRDLLLGSPIVGDSGRFSSDHAGAGGADGGFRL
jgi:hypothetical protein